MLLWIFPQKSFIAGCSVFLQGISNFQTNLQNAQLIEPIKNGNFPFNSDIKTVSAISIVYYNI